MGYHDCSNLNGILFVCGSLSAIYPVTKARSPKVKVFLQFLDEALKIYGF
jgi:hypothetical protein